MIRLLKRLFCGLAGYSDGDLAVELHNRLKTTGTRMLLNDKRILVVHKQKPESRAGEANFIRLVQWLKDPSTRPDDVWRG